MLKIHPFLSQDEQRLASWFSENFRITIPFASEPAVVDGQYQGPLTFLMLQFNEFQLSFLPGNEYTNTGRGKF